MVKIHNIDPKVRRFNGCDLFGVPFERGEEIAAELDRIYQRTNTKAEFIFEAVETVQPKTDEEQALMILLIGAAIG